jgi:hypothetical protein
VEVRDAAGELVCLTVYRRGAREVVRRLGLVTARRNRQPRVSMSAAIVSTRDFSGV